MGRRVQTVKRVTSHDFFLFTRDSFILIRQNKNDGYTNVESDV